MRDLVYNKVRIIAITFITVTAYNEAVKAYCIIKGYPPHKTHII